MPFLRKNDFYSSIVTMNILKDNNHLVIRCRDIDNDDQDTFGTDIYL